MKLDLRLSSWMPFLLLLLMVPRVQASVLFEAYSKVLLSGAHIGFVVERYEFDEKKKEFTGAYVLKLTTAAGSTTESMQARCSASLAPISYTFTSLADKKAESIDATFSGSKMTLKIRDGDKVRTESKTVPKGVFLSRFLTYLMLQSKEGIKTGAKYSFKAIAEEDGKIYDGDAFVQGREEVAGESAFKIVTKFKGAQFIGMVTPKGEALTMRSPSLSLSSEVVADPAEATAGQKGFEKTLKAIFGAVPAGRENVVARKASTPPALQIDASKKSRIESPALVDATADTPKKSGVPGGNGMELKPTKPLDK